MSTPVSLVYVCVYVCVVIIVPVIFSFTAIVIIIIFFIPYLHSVFLVSSLPSRVAKSSQSSRFVALLMECRPADHTKPDDCHKQPFKLKKNKQRRKQMELMKQNEIRQQIQRHRVLQGVAQVAGTSNLQDLSLSERLNSVERGGGRGGAAERGVGSRKNTSIDGDSSNDKRKKRKRRRRRRSKSIISYRTSINLFLY